MGKEAKLVGMRFKRLTVIKRIGTKWDTALWLCGCYCGKYTEVTTAELRRTRKPRETCGQCYDHIKYPSEWLAWRNMQTRCYKEGGPDYPNYGGRGIGVYKPWRLEFLDFLIHIGLKPEVYDLSLDRIDNNKDYEPGNVRWANRWTQNWNKRNTDG